MESRLRSKTPARKRARTGSRKPTKRSLSYGPRNARIVATVGPTVGLGTSLTTSLRTSFFANVTSAATGIFTAYLKPGSAYDPAGDLTAIQPALFDQYAGVFSRYKVNKFTVKITVIAASATNSRTYNAAAYPSTDSSSLATYQAAASQPWAKTIVGTFYSLGASAGGTQKEVMYFKDISNDAVVGVRSDTYDTGAVVGADPPAGQYAVMPIFIQSNVAEANNYVLHIDIWQNVTFNQRKPVADA